MLIEKYLQAIGLSDKEASVYLSLLSVDSASVLELAKKTKINRTTIYFVLESLSKKGLVSEIQQGKKTFFAAEAPERLSTYIERQKVILEDHAKELQTILPEIKAVQREIGERPVVKYFEGRDAAFSANTEFFSTATSKNTTGYFLTNYDLIHEVFTKEELIKAQDARPQKKIRAKTMYATSNNAHFPSNELSERKQLDHTQNPVLCDISIYEDKVQIITLGKKISAILIQSSDVANTMKTLFQLAFDKLP